MPSLVRGAIKFVSVSGGATINFGDTGYIAPKIAEKTYYGAGANDTGDFTMSHTRVSNTNTFDGDGIDNRINTKR